MLDKITSNIQWFQKEANSGDANAQYNLGACYEVVAAVKNIDQAVKFYRLAAEQGHGPAQLCLGFHYETGEGTEKKDM